MNLLLVRPPDPLQHASLLSHTAPMNLAYLASYARASGARVAIVDYETDPFNADAFARLLRETRPEVLGVSCVTPTIAGGARLCEIAKAVDRRIITVVGGPHANALPEQTLEEFPAFDCLVQGEGEVTLGELCRRVSEGDADRRIPGLVHRAGSGIDRNPERGLLPDIDVLPFPARDLIVRGSRPGHSTRGFSNKIASTELYTSRGCPFGCSFCAIQATFGTTVRFRAPSFIEEEVSAMVRDHRIGHLVIADDTFTLQRDRAFAICDILGRSGIASWNCDTRATSVSKDLLRAMRESGCRKVAFGVESGSQRILDAIGKKITVDQVRQAVSWAHDAGIRHIEGNFIIGSDPSETEHDISLTRKLIRELPWTFVSVSVIVPYPGTPVHLRMTELGLIPPGIGWEEYVMFGVPPRWRTVHFSPSDLLRHQKRLTRQFYLDPAYVFRQLAAVRSWSDIRYWASAGAAYLKWHFSGRL